MLSRPKEPKSGKKLSLSGSKLTLGNIDASKLRSGSEVGGARKAVQVEVRRNRAPTAPVIPVLFDTSPALETGEITAGISAANIEEVKKIISPMLRHDSFDRLALRKRTDVVRLITGVRFTGDDKGSTLLSKDLSPCHKEESLTEEQKEFFSIAFPFYNESRATYCTPIGAKVILNFLAVYGTEEYVEGNYDTRNKALTELNSYAQSLNLSDDNSFDMTRDRLTAEERAARVRALQEGLAKADAVRKPNGQFEKGYSGNAGGVPKDEEIKRNHEKTPEELAEERRLRNMFRNRLLTSINHKPVCPFTGISDVRFLIASHIKPYAACENTGEKVDPQNGFMLSPNADKLFDCGYISFTEDGTLKRSKKITGALLAALGIKSNVKAIIKGDRCKEYLAYHREFVFEGERTKDKEF